MTIFVGAIRHDGCDERLMYDNILRRQAFLMVKQASANQGAAPQIEIVQRWDEELNRLLPITH